MSDKTRPMHDPRETLTPLVQQLRRLEPRIVLDGVGVAPPDQDDPSTEPAHEPADASASAATDHNDHANSAPNDAHPVRTLLQSAWRWLLGDRAANDAAPPERILAVSSAIDAAADLTGAVQAGVVTVDIGTDLADLLESLRAQAADGRVDSIALATHGLTPGQFELAGEHISPDSLHQPHIAQFWRDLGDLVQPGGRIDLLACNAAEGARGTLLIAQLEALTGRDVAASTDPTGATTLGGDWLLESDRVDLVSHYFQPKALQSFNELLAQPVVTDSDVDLTATGAGDAVLIDPGITLTDSGDGTLLGLLVQIGDGFNAAEDLLAWDTELATALGINVHYDAATGTLRMENEVATANYQALLRTVTYENTSTTPSGATREISVLVGDDFVDAGAYFYNPDNGHYYRAVTASLTWDQARTGAESLNIGGLNGYLATITSAGEDAFVTPLIPAPTPPPFPLQPTPLWIGAVDAAGDDAWHWITGPEGDATADGTLFSNGSTAVGDAYINWLAGEPNQAGVSYGVILHGGGWQDLWTGAKGFLAEFGGDDADTEGGLNARITISIETPNHAPVLDADGSFTLDAIAEDAANNSGTSIANLLASAGGDRVTDYNADPEGIALTGANTARGTWEYSTDAGATWQSIGAVSDDNALLLRDSDYLRFVPAANWNGALPAAISFRAWDQTSGIAGDHVSTAINGGATPFSAADADASITIHPVNDAPTWVGTSALQLAAQIEDVLTTAGTRISDLIAGRTADVDGPAPDGIALVGADTAHGNWQYSRDGGASWTTLDSVSDTHALLLAGTDRIRLVADADWNGTLNDALALRVWDRSDGSAGSYVDTSSGTFVSLATRSARLMVSAVNDAPTVDHPIAALNAAEDAASSATLPLNAFADIDGDTLTWSAALANGAALPSWLSFDANTRTFTGTPAQIDVGTLDLRIRVSDADGAIADQFITLTIASVNDAPTIASPLADLNVSVGEPLSWTVPAGTFFDEDPADTLTYAATLTDGTPLPEWLTFDPLTGALAALPSNEHAGEYAIALRATDAAGASVVAQFTLRIEAAPADDPPPVEPPAEPDVPPTNHGGSGGDSGGNNSGADTGSAADPIADAPTDSPTESTSDPLTDADAPTSDSDMTTSEPSAETDPGDAEAPTEAESANEPADAAPAEAPTNSDSESTNDAADATADAAADGNGSAVATDATGAAAAAGGGATADIVRMRELEEYAPLGQDELGTQINDALFNGDLLADADQPVEFRGAWDAILGAYVDTGFEVASYLESAFRVVTEAAVLYRDAETAADALNVVLDLDPNDPVAIEAQSLLDQLALAREEVRVASSELEGVIQAAAQAGKAERFDQVLEDLLVASLERLMNANAALYMETHAVAAVVAGMRDHGATPVNSADAVRTLARNARDDAQDEINEMRKRWDRIAQDVFSAFVAELVAKRGGAPTSADAPVQPPSLTDTP